ncbi:MAG: lytic transglycosylase domain-containing protein, partial [Clostridiales bacterium]|nr:lytic transglycosylase domain-containing protein [Clostridiales bacterium]
AVGLFGIILGLKAIYPNKYYDIIQIESSKRNVDINLIRAVIWTESKYDRLACSRVGAKGVMQLMPSTAQWLAKRQGLVDYDLYNAKDNIVLGVSYLNYLIEIYDDTLVALAAYNAGPGNVNSWLIDERYGKDGRLYCIPYLETSKYVQKVFNTSKVYSWLY